MKPTTIQWGRIAPFYFRSAINVKCKTFTLYKKKKSQFKNFGRKRKMIKTTFD